MKPTLVVVTAILASAAASPTRADVLARLVHYISGTGNGINGRILKRQEHLVHRKQSLILNLR